MNLIPCTQCDAVFDSTLTVLIHKHENHKSLSNSQKQLLKNWVDVQ